MEGSVLAALAVSGGKQRPLGGLRMAYRAPHPSPSSLRRVPADVLFTGASPRSKEVVAAARGLVLLCDGDADGAHEAVASATFGPAMYVHSLIHRAEGPLLGDPPANVQGYLNSNYWNLRTAHDAAGNDGIRIGAKIPESMKPGVHPVWVELGRDPLFTELASDETFRAVRQGARDAGYPCGRFNTAEQPPESCWDPYAFTLVCERVAAGCGSERLLELCHQLQRRETRLLAASLDAAPSSL
eukprot:TRINITY_DN15842_c0_g1_i1.p1 TRINITY_DN15842_c0_g1~~TRINITY_DN15842_c0_g1_i1.p1  ORF type:complete len:242 (+),score=66.29 TRINITY_DN15842_c0_g1_i1:77-802(+)